MVKKSFKTAIDPALDFISKETIDSMESKEETKDKTETENNPTAHGGSVGRTDPLLSKPKVQEKKNRRVQLVMKPSTYEKAKERANAAGISVSELVGILIENEYENFEK